MTLHLRSTQFQIIILAATCVGVACAVTWMRIATVKRTYEYVQNQKELNRLQTELQAERVQWLRLTSPKKLELLARHLGLFAPRVDQIVRFKTPPNGKASP